MNMKNLPKANILERAIAAISPSWALERHKNRVAMALSGGYTGASYRDNLVTWQPGTADADGDTLRDLKELRARTRDLVRNSAIAGGAIETQVSHVVGTGLTMQSRIDADYLGLDEDAAGEWQRNAEREFRLWAESTYADAFGQQNFYELQDLAFRSRLESGDCFVILAGVRREGWPYRLALQVIEADRVCNENFKANTDNLVAGIERGQNGEAVAIYVTNKHPGSQFITKGLKWTRVAIRSDNGRLNVLHIMRKLRPGQTRGVPELAPIISLVKQLSRYSDAEVDAAVNSAAFAIFTKMDAEAFQDVFNDDAQGAIIDNAKRWDGTLRTGAAINLMPGESIETAQMSRPNPNFEGFVRAVMVQIGMALNIPFEVLAKQFNSSYSASRAALLDAWRTFRIRREFLASKLCQPVYEAWLTEAVASGRITAPGFFADAATSKAWCGTTWSGDGPGSIDPLKEASAAEKRMNIGLSTLAEEINAYDGGDWPSKHKQQVRERAEREEGGLVGPVVPPMANGMPATPPEEPGEGEDTPDTPEAE